MLADHDGHIPNGSGKGQHQQPSMPKTKNNPFAFPKQGLGCFSILMGMIGAKGQVEAIESE
jgi:hypothetical protein